MTVQTAKLFAKEFASLGVYNKNPTPQKKKEVLLYHQQYLQVSIPHLLGYYELPRFALVKDLDKPNSTEASKNKITTNANKDKVQGNLPILG